MVSIVCVSKRKTLLCKDTKRKYRVVDDPEIGVCVSRNCRSLVLFSTVLIYIGILSVNIWTAVA